MKLPINGPLAKRNVSNLQFQYLRTAMHSAREAVRIFIEDVESSEDIALHSGIALEAWVKLSLSCENPILLIDRPDDQAIRILAGIVPVAGARERFQTISGEIACKRMQWIRPDFPYSKNSGDEIVFQARNAAAHGGAVHEKEAEEALGCMVRLVKWITCNDILFKDAEEFALWLDHRDVAKGLALQNQMNHELRIEALIAEAAARYRKRFANVEDQQVRVLYASSRPESFGELYRSRVVRKSCPACPQEGWLYCEEQGELEDGAVILYPFEFECPVCELKFDGEYVKFLGMNGGEFTIDRLAIEPFDN